MTVYFTPKALKAFEVMTRGQPKLAWAIKRKLQKADDERENQNELDVKRLQGTKEPLYRLRVGSLRIEYTLGQRELVVTRMEQRGQLYK